MLRATLKRAAGNGLTGEEIALAEPEGQGGSGASRPETKAGAGARDGDIDRRLRDLDAALAARRPAAEEADGRPGGGGMSGIGNALRLSSEFIAAILVGAGLGWFLDRMAGTSPWGLIVFLFLGFGAGVLNVLRASGTVADFGAVTRDKGGDRPDGK
jgi:ATP synthase protein I